jgi:hypothetical protein
VEGAGIPDFGGVQLETGAITARAPFVGTYQRREKPFTGINRAKSHFRAILAILTCKKCLIYKGFSRKFPWIPDGNFLTPHGNFLQRYGNCCEAYGNFEARGFGRSTVRKFVQGRVAILDIG